MSLDRRTFVRASGMAAAAFSTAQRASAQDRGGADRGDTAHAAAWRESLDRPWLGADYWANPLQDWRVAGGRVECLNAAGNRNVHLLTRDLSERNEPFTLEVLVGRPDGSALAGKGAAGFRVGARGPLREYRNNLLAGGLDAGLTMAGGLFIGELASARDGQVSLDRREVRLRLEAAPEDAARTRLTLTALDGRTGEPLGDITRVVPSARLAGNLAIVANFGGERPVGRPASGLDAFWFSDWTVVGGRVDRHDDRAFGPLLFSQYTVSRGVLKLTAQLAPLGAADQRAARLETREGDDGAWREIARAEIDPLTCTATFRVEPWDAGRDAAYRVAYTLRNANGAEQEHFWEGLVRRDPREQPVLTVADISCNIHAAFPNQEFTEKLRRANPDLLAFVGDQFYESTGGYGIVSQPLERAALDYLRKWYMHGWTWRELTRDRPSVALPDDHDVYQGNIWGEAGAPRQRTQEAGGYTMDARWVNVVHRTQTSHHPDPHDPRPIDQGITVYHGPLVWGGVSFAILADRMFKTGPDGVAPPTGGRADHVTDPSFDPKAADVPGAELLGERQMKFLEEWLEDWEGAEMKGVISQTIFSGMATTHGGERQRLVADYDTNGWPQSARNAALRLIRKAGAIHLAGDQHLPAVIHYGIDKHRDAGVAYAGPAVNVGYPRWFEPERPGEHRRPGAPEVTGDFRDTFGHPMTVLAVFNPAIKPQAQDLLELMTEKGSGFGLVRFDKSKRQVVLEGWPYSGDPSDPQSPQWPGWPVTVSQQENLGAAIGYLPAVDLRGLDQPLVKVYDSSTGELVYAIRPVEELFHPPVFQEGPHQVVVVRTL